VAGGDRTETFEMKKSTNRQLSPDFEPSPDPQVLWACCEIPLQTALWFFGRGCQNGWQGAAQDQLAYTNDSGPPDHRAPCEKQPRRFRSNL